MPEEKKDKKVVVVGAEGAKKDSFTFSDKIKNSKPAASKSFANRISSKIGSDGKPKKTLFERTKRDAPFFIAAIVALLLLPFLYKYSGSVEDNPAIVTPGEDNVEFNPNARSGFDSIGDPEGQIAQLSGRDSMDLIVGFGSKKTEEEDPFRYDQFDRSGMDDTSYSSANNRDEEYNTTNEYRIRKKAPAATRAAFKKTPIGSLRSAGLASRSGGKLGVGMWGGGLKQAANKVKGDAPKSSPKPVSLQPLQAAGKPSRSYFGQGAAAEARRSKDAMSKANAMQALMDAQMKPVEPGKIGGIAGGDFGGPGGGNGNLERKFAFNGKEPWWWDMMKKRSQMEWEAKFNRKWDWIKFGDKLAQKLLDGVLSCLLTGTDDWSMGKIGGAVAGAGAEAKCGDLNEAAWNDCETCKQYGKFGKYNCRNYLASLPNQESTMVKKGWQGSNSSDVDLNFFQVRWDCLTNGAFGARKARKGAEGKVEEVNSCATFYQDGNYTATVSGDYTLYSYVVGVEKDDWDAYTKATSDDKRKEALTVKYFQKGGTLSVDPNKQDQVINLRAFVPLFVESVAVKNKKIDKKKMAKINDDQLDDLVSYNGYFGLGDKKHQCGAFKNKHYAEAVKLCQAKKPALTCRKDCMDSINEQIRGKNKVKMLGSIDANTGMPYNSFMDLLREGGAMNDADSGGLAAKGGKEGKDWVTGARCAYPLAFVSCHHNATQADEVGGRDASGAPAAFLTFPNVGKDLYKNIVKRFTVTYRVGDRLAPQGKEGYSTKGYFAQQVKTLEGYVGGAADNSSNYNPNNDKKYNISAAGKGRAAIEQMMGRQDDVQSAGQSATVTWEVRQCWDQEFPWRYGRAIEDGACGRTMTSLAEGVDGSQLPGQIVSTATCVYGDDITISARRQTPDEEQDEDRDDQDHDPDNNPDVGPGHQQEPGSSRLAPRLAWIPQTPTDRVVVEGNPTADSFGRTKAITTVANNTQKCGGSVGELVMDSTAAKNFVSQVVAAYNARNPQTPIRLGNNLPKVGEFVDALNIASTVGIANVAKSAVCELGRRMIDVSEDRDAQDPSFHNELGVFYAYIHPEAVLYPAKFYGSSSNCDKRFMAYQTGTCRATSGLQHKYHYNNYTYAGTNGGAGISAYDRSVPAAVKRYPLAALAEGISFNGLATCRQLRGGKSCGAQVNQYKQAFGFLVDGSRDPQGTGQACAALTGDMPVAKALDYVKTACEIGLDFKPNGAGDSRTGGSGNSVQGGSQNENAQRD